MILSKDIGDHIIYSDGSIFGKRFKKILKPIKCERGYCRMDINGRRIRVHRLIAETFLPNPNNYTQVNHIDGNTSNNNLENLEWCNASMNQKHAYAIGLREPMIGQINHRAKLSNTDVAIIRECISVGFKGRDIANYFKVKPTTISMLKRGKNWAKV